MDDFLWYLASPFKSSQQAIERLRFMAVAKCSGMLAAQGVCAVSPILNGYTMRAHMGFNQMTEDDFKAWDHVLMPRCNGILVLQLEGWKESVGLSDELDHFAERHAPVAYIHQGFWRNTQELHLTLERVKFAQKGDVYATGE